VCGFVGLLGPDAHDVNKPALANSILHRGPDYQADFTGENLYVAASVLNTVPGKNWHQPISDELGYMLCFNGVIYNVRELAKKYLPSFTSESGYCDSDLVFRLLRHCGTSILNLFDGMFALVWKDKTNLYLARDKFGIKPLHFGRMNSRTLIFGSELKAIKAAMSQTLQLNCLALTETFVFGFPIGNKTLLENIFSLEPGSCWKYQIDKTCQYPSLVWRSRASLERYRYEYSVSIDTLKKSVAQCVLGVSTPGMLLSGGIDSALIARALPKNIRQNFKSIFLAYPNDYSEYSTHLLLANNLGLKSYRHSANGNFFEEIIESIFAVERPVIQSSSYVAGTVSKSLGIRSLLTGDGADELFDGYPALAKPKTFTKRYRNRLQILNNLPTKISDVISDKINNIQSDRNLLESYLIGDQLASGQCEVIDKGLMYSGIEGRYPYLTDSINLGSQQIPKRSRTGKKQSLRSIAKRNLPAHITNQLLGQQKYAANSIQSNFVGQTIRLVKKLDQKGYFHRHPMKWLTRKHTELFKIDVFAQQFGLLGPRINSDIDLLDERERLFEYYKRGYQRMLDSD